jgi:hypothetical protein
VLGLRRKQAREGLEDLDRLRRAAQHQAIPLLQSVHAARDAGIDVAQALLREREGAPHRVAVVAVAAVDHGIPGGKKRDDVADRVLHRGARGQCEQDHAFAIHARAQRGEILQALHAALFPDSRARRPGLVVAQDADAAAREAPRHACTHPAQADDSDLHVLLLNENSNSRV